jgi:2-oxoglutarate ferredoxin oxidoreductase subunit alpha
LPTKTEQADLYQALYGRNGESPIVVLAPASPKDCFYMAYQAVKISLEYMVPVMLLSDGYIANGAEPWKYPTIESLPTITTKFATPKHLPYQPYLRDQNFARTWAVPGMKDMQHRIGGLEKENITGHVSYDPDNHALMVKLRQLKVDKVQDIVPPLTCIRGNNKSKLLVLGWGSTLGAISTAVENAQSAGMDVAQAQLKYLNPLPANLASFLNQFDAILIPELNAGQLAFYLKGKLGVEAIKLNKIEGKPFFAREIFDKINEIYNASV